MVLILHLFNDSQNVFVLLLPLLFPCFTPALLVTTRCSLVCFELEEFETAQKSFETSLTFQKSTQDPSVAVYNRWIRKCEIEIKGIFNFFSFLFISPADFLFLDTFFSSFHFLRCYHVVFFPTIFSFHCCIRYVTTSYYILSFFFQN